MLELLIPILLILVLNRKQTQASNQQVITEVFSKTPEILPIYLGNTQLLSHYSKTHLKFKT